MCEATAYVLRNGKEEVLMTDIDTLEPQGEVIKITSLFGEEKIITGRIKTISLVDHKILIEEAY